MTPEPELAAAAAAANNFGAGELKDCVSSTEGTTPPPRSNAHTGESAVQAYRSRIASSTAFRCLTSSRESTGSLRAISSMTL